jgi:hypothetical protein
MGSRLVVAAVVVLVLVAGADAVRNRGSEPPSPPPAAVEPPPVVEVSTLTPEPRACRPRPPGTAGPMPSVIVLACSDWALYGPDRAIVEMRPADAG